MNSLIENIFKNFRVDNKKIPISFIKYNGTETTYITYQEINIDGTMYADDELQSFVDYYDLDIYSKSNYFKIVSEVKKIMKNNGFRWQPSMSSGDLFENDTGYYHKSLCFSIERNEN